MPSDPGALSSILYAVGAFWAGLLGKIGHDRVRERVTSRRANGGSSAVDESRARSDAAAAASAQAVEHLVAAVNGVATAVREEGRQTRHAMRESNQILTGELAKVHRDTTVLLDRTGKGRGPAVGNGGV